MFKLIEAIFGVLLFLFLGGLLVLKNQENHYTFQAYENYTLPIAFLKEEIKKEISIPYIQSFFPWSMEINSVDSSFSDLSSSYRILDKNYGNQHLKFQLDTLQNTLTLSIEGEKNILLKLYWILNAKQISKIQRDLPMTVKEELLQVEKKFYEHRTRWNGVQSSAPIYYIALEKSWDSLPSTAMIIDAHQELNDFASQRQIIAQGEVFTVYPISSGRKIWRFALPVDRYYRTQSKTVQCRRFRGGNYMSVSHLGPKNTLNKTWQQLQDSLTQTKYTLAYPPIERYPVHRENESNPYKWETELILAIKE